MIDDDFNESAARRESKMTTYFQLDQANLAGEGDTIHWSGLAGSSRSLAIADACRTSTRPVVVIARDDADATAVLGELRFFASDAGRLLLFLPSTETLPYDQESPPKSIISQRHNVLFQLATGIEKPFILVVSASTFLLRVASPSFWSAEHEVLVPGKEINIGQCVEILEALGYEKVVTARERGEYCVNGLILDIVPIGSPIASRVRFGNDRIESMHGFNVNTQRLAEPLSSCLILPTREFPIDSDAKSRFRAEWRNYFNGIRVDSILEAVISGHEIPSGAEAYLPFFTETVSIAEFLPRNSAVILLEGAMSGSAHFWQSLKARYSDIKTDPRRQVLKPEEIWMGPSWIDDFSREQGRVIITNDRELEDTIDFSGESTGITRSGSIEEIIETIRPWRDGAGHILYCMHSDTRREEMEILSSMLGQNPAWLNNWSEFGRNGVDVAIALAEIDEGFYLSEADLLVVTEKEIFGQIIFQKLDNEIASDADYQRIRDLSILEIDNPLVHLKYGVGRFAGLERYESDGILREFVVIKYAENGKIFVKLTDLHLVSRYSGFDLDKVPLDRASSEKWTIIVANALRDIRSTARALLALHAEKQAFKGAGIPPPDVRFNKFVAEFPFQDTRDQRAAVDAIIHDMVSGAVMDRVVCGDVGFGKTEVAMRAAFLAFAGGFQTAVMVPTTLLAQQHFESFKRRFSSFGVKVVLMTRHNDKKAERVALSGIESGEVHIVIGTHRLIQGDVHYHRLGLFVIDEEHRFGVKQKELIKGFRGRINMLSLTATPIPRTLSMSLHGVRDLSMISTPPAKRLSIRTYVVEHNEGTIREAIRRELMRNGQAFYVHNEIESIEATCDFISALVPEARVRFCHGQMSEMTLGATMSAFYAREFDVLVCTTVIETGIDVPNANTIIIDAADHFGLAQLHQLRGRVGRSQRQAYAYLIQSSHSMSEAGERRLAAMRKATSLGDGYLLATHDLEIRGAGELLGEEQSGQIQLIGFQMYIALLEREIRSLQEGGEGASQIDVEDVYLDAHVDAIIPSEYVADDSLRLALYKRISSATDVSSIEEIRTEMVERFGPIPAEAEPLFTLAQLKIRQREAGVVRLAASAKGATLDVDGQQILLRSRLNSLCNQMPNTWSQETIKTRYRWVKDLPEGEERLSELFDLLDQIAP